MKNLHQLMGKNISQHYMAVLNSYISININPKFKWTNCPNQKTQANWIKSQNPSVCCIQTHLTCKDTQRLKTKGRRKIYQPNGEQKEKNRSCDSSL